VFALVRGNAENWNGTIVALLVAAAVLLAAFVAAELRRADPMFDLTLFRKPAFTGASIAAIVLSASMFSMFLYLTLYVQNQLGYSPLEAGLRFLPITLLSFLVAPIAGRLSARVPVRLLMGSGLLLVGIGLLLMRRVAPGDGWTVLLPGFIVAGAGVGLTNPPLASTAVGVVEPRRAGMASGINSTFRQVGIATGIAALGAVFQRQLEHKTGLPNGDALSLVPLARVPAPARDVVRAGFVGALDDILLIAAIVALVGSALTFALVRQRDFVAPPE
jgi:predicted MFS family arabinose efflux permease